ncbi:hypothetical protein V2W45_1207736, partial [Cenococcum geophilum]
EIFYYKRCLKDNTSATTFRRYLKTKYRIFCIVRKAKADVNTKATLAALFELDNTRRDLKVIKILKEAVSEKDFLDSLYYLIITYNLPYLIIKWPKFRTFLYVYNYILVGKGGLLIKSQNSVPLLL